MAYLYISIKNYYFGYFLFNRKARQEKKRKVRKEKNDYLTEVPNGIARLCDLWENFAPFAVKENTPIINEVGKANYEIIRKEYPKPWVILW